MNRLEITNRTLADCLNFRAGAVNDPKTEIIDVETIHGRSVLTYLPLNHDGDIPDYYLKNVGAEVGGATDIFTVSNIFMKDGILYGSGFIPQIRYAGNIEWRDSFKDFNIEGLVVDKILNNPQFLISSHTSAHTFYHFMVDYMPRLMIMEKWARPVTPFIFSRNRMDFQYQAMDLFINKILPVHNMFSGILIRECAIMTPTSKVDAVDFLRKGTAHVRAEKSAERLYVSRRYARSRRVVNELELEPVLKIFGFQIVYCENMNLETQIALFKSAEFVCAPHGAGLANIAYCESRASVLEIIMPERFPLGALFWEMACAADLDYHILVGARIPINEADLTDGDIYVEPKRLEAALSFMIEQKFRA